MIHRYRFISEHHTTYGVARLCRVLAVQRRQGYYEWLAAQPARRQRADAEDQLAAEIRAIHAQHRGLYGSPRITDELRRRGRPVNRKRAERIMRERGIVGVARCRGGEVPDDQVRRRRGGDVLLGQPAAPPTRERLVGDITYLPTGEGWLYLAP
jgi:transposase InsO family protein